MDSAAKSALIGRNSVIIAAVISLAAQVAKLDMAPEAVQALAVQISDIITLAGVIWAGIASAWSRHRAKKAAQAADEAASEPPSILGNSGKASLTYLLYLALAVAGLCAILVGTYSCANNGQTVIMPKESKIALARIAARRMGADMRQEFATVARQVVASYQAIEEAEGVAYQEGVYRIARMVLEHQGVRDSDLLVADARDVLEIFGVKLPGAGFDLAWLQQFDPADIRAICEAFLEGADA